MKVFIFYLACAGAHATLAVSFAINGIPWAAVCGALAGMCVAFAFIRVVEQIKEEGR